MKKISRIFRSAGLTLTPEVVILCKKLWRARGPGTVRFDILIDIHQNSAVSKAFLGRFKSQIIDINFEG